MKARLDELEHDFVAAMQNHMENPSEAVLHRAYELGRKALHCDLGVLEMASLHHAAMLKLLSAAATSEQSTRLLKDAESFFVESLAPFEMTHRAVRDANKALRQVNERLEDEAKRIATSLHEETGQFLACTYLALDEIRSNLPPRYRGKLQKVRNLLEQIAEHLRQLSHELRPTVLDDYGLIPAVEFLAAGISKRSNLEITVEGPSHGRFAAAVETAIYRVVAEDLTNVSKHARASRVNIRIQQEPETLHCWITDNGVGLESTTTKTHNKNGGLGLIGIRQRLDAIGGTLQIQSEPGRGTQLHLSIPLEN